MKRFLLILISLLASGGIVARPARAQTARPIFSPMAGLYSGTQSVTISDATTGAAIHYTTDGSTPTSGSTLYTGAISVTSTETLKALAVSAATSLTIHPPNAAISAGVELQFSAADNLLNDVTSWVTWQSSDPGIVAISSTGMALGVAPGTVTIRATEPTPNSAIASATYTISSQVATPAFSPSAGTYTSSPQSVTISDSTGGSSIHYTVDGSTPTPSSTLYTGAISVASTTTVKAIGTASGLVDSSVGSAIYTINQAQTATPAFGVAAGTYSSTQSVTLSDSTGSAAIYYTIDGSTPTPSSTLYTGAISVAITSTVKAMATASGLANSAVASAGYTIASSSIVPQSPGFLIE